MTDCILLFQNMLKSLRYRLLITFLAFLLFAIMAIVPYNLIYRQKESTISNFSSIVNSLQLNLNKDLKLSESFLIYETTNPNFFITGESTFLDQHYAIKDSIEKDISRLGFYNSNSLIGIKGEINQIITGFKDYNRVFDSLIFFIYKRGYYNYGLEGEMMSYINRFEDLYSLDKTLLFKIRQNEKDYIIRNDSGYIANLLKLSNALSAQISGSKNINSKQKNKLHELLNNYISSFHNIVSTDKKIGFTQDEGLKFLLNQKSKFIENQLLILREKSEEFQQNYMAELNRYYFVFLIILLVFSIAISYLISKHILHHLENLNSYISKLTKHKFRYHETLDLKNATREIAHIYMNFRNLVATLDVWEKQLNEALANAEKNEKKYRELADLLPQSIFETDELGNYTYVNRAWYTSFGFDQIDLYEGLNIIETIISDTNTDLLGHNKIENAHFIAKRKDGTQFPASVYTDNIIQNDKITGRRGIIIDITERNQYIESLQLQKSKAETSDQYKSSFLANMSHEIRTPMNSIIGFTNLLSSNTVPEDQKSEFIAYIQSSGEMLLNLIDDIIDIAKIEAGEIKITKIECNINEILNDLERTFEGLRNKLNKQHLELTQRVPEKQELHLRTDPFRLKQIFTNLIGNALKFTEKGSIEFGYIFKDSAIEFFVKDTGVGLTSDELITIFERFKRTKSSEEQKISGTGLGLSISKNLVELLGGKMWVDSTPGKGTVFYFTLPYLRVAAPVKSNKLTLARLQDYNFSNKTILVVEDDLHSFSYLKELLKRAGATVVWAQDGETAVEMSKNNTNIDLILMDIQLPSLNGFDATKEIRKFKSNLPIIAQTAYAMDGDKEKSVLAGCDDYVSKPIEPQNLFAKINQFFRTEINGNTPVKPEDKSPSQPTTLEKFNITRN
ncbi:MAG: response regulator [Bacteroidales bacterium]|nr:response regulator [Bacteroidales bacterium]